MMFRTLLDIDRSIDRRRARDAELVDAISPRGIPAGLFDQLAASTSFLNRLLDERLEIMRRAADWDIEMWWLASWPGTHWPLWPNEPGDQSGAVPS